MQWQPLHNHPIWHDQFIGVKEAAEPIDWLTIYVGATTVAGNCFYDAIGYVLTAALDLFCPPTIALQHARTMRAVGNVTLRGADIKEARERKVRMTDVRRFAIGLYSDAELLSDAHRTALRMQYDIAAFTGGGKGEVVDGKVVELLNAFESGKLVAKDYLQQLRAHMTTRRFLGDDIVVQKLVDSDPFRNLELGLILVKIASPGRLAVHHFTSPATRQSALLFNTATSGWEHWELLGSFTGDRAAFHPDIFFSRASLPPFLGSHLLCKPTA